MRWRDEGVVGRERRPGSIWMCSLGGKVGGGEGGRGVGGMVVLRGEDARRKAAISEGGAVGERRGRSGAGRAAPSGGIGAVGRRRGCGKACTGGGGRRGDEGGMRVGGVGTVPAAGSVGACTCRLDRQWGLRGRRGRCDGQRWGSVEGCLGRGLRRRGDGGWRRRGRRWRSFQR